MGQLGFSEMLMIFVIALLVFGPKKLPELGKSLGKGIREFKKATDELKSSWEDQVKDISEPINDFKRDLHSMGQNLKTDFQNHIEKAVETESKPQTSEHPAAAAPAAVAPETHEASASAHATEPSNPKEHV
jgi:TatA/E family protein of Tat protein translocase